MSATDPKSARAQAREFATQHAVALAAEIIEWKDTALLRDGLLRELAAICQPFAAHDALQVAESIAVHAALDRCANQVQPAIPAGFALVPIKPTPEMLTAQAVPCGEMTAAKTWRAMIGAATVAQPEQTPALYGNRGPQGRVQHVAASPEAVRNEAEAWGQPVHELVALYVGPMPATGGGNG